MRKLLLLILLLLLLAACGTAEPAEPTDEPAKEDPEPAEVSEPAVSESPVESKASSLSADPVTPAETAAEAGIIRDRDWSKGTDDPLVTIIEYGDFQ